MPPWERVFISQCLLKCQKRVCHPRGRQQFTPCIVSIALHRLFCYQCWCVPIGWWQKYFTWYWIAYFMSNLAQKRCQLFGRNSQLSALVCSDGTETVAVVQAPVSFEEFLENRTNLQWWPVAKTEGLIDWARSCPQVNTSVPVVYVVENESDLHSHSNSFR